METISFLTDPNELPETLKGNYGKEIGKDYKLAYLGNVIIGQAESKDILEKYSECPHYDWIEIGNKLFLAFIGGK